MLNGVAFILLHYGNQSNGVSYTFRHYTLANLNYLPDASRLLVRRFLRWRFGAADPTKLAQCCRDRSFSPTYTISFNGPRMRWPCVLAARGGYEYLDFKLFIFVDPTARSGQVFPSQG
jgi:hypothetical protein